jgi:hypothetical protein
MTATVHAFPGAFSAECPACLGRAWDTMPRESKHVAVFRCKGCGRLLRFGSLDPEKAGPAVLPALPSLVARALAALRT